MNARWRTADGHVIEVIDLSCKGSGEGEWLRVKRPTGHLLAVVRVPGELSGLGIDLAGLTEEEGPHAH